MVTQYIPIDQAAIALGVTERALRRLAHTGDLPEAKFVGDRWVVDYQGLPAIATRQRFVLDLTDAKEEAPPVRLRSGPSPLSKSDAEQSQQPQPKVDGAAQAREAVTEARLAKAQSRTEHVLLEAEQLRADYALDQEKAEARLRYLRELEDYADYIEEENRALAAKVDQLVANLDNEYYQRAALAERYQALESERNDLLCSLGWVGKRRLLLRQTSNQRHRSALESATTY